jgi:predicted transcriptional regulator of viral defense system
VFSHRTALSLHDLTDVNPSKIDLTVPPAFRKGSAIPAVLHLHYAAVPDSDREVIGGVPVTTPLRAIVDVWVEGTMPKPALQTAFAEAMRRGTITKRQVDRARKQPDVAEIVHELEGRKR